MLQGTGGCCVVLFLLGGFRNLQPYATYVSADQPHNASTLKCAHMLLDHVHIPNTCFSRVSTLPGAES